MSRPVVSSSSSAWMRRSRPRAVSSARSARPCSPPASAPATSSSAGPRSAKTAWPARPTWRAGLGGKSREWMASATAPRSTCQACAPACCPAARHPPQGRAGRRARPSPGHLARRGETGRAVRLRAPAGGAAAAAQRRAAAAICLSVPSIAYRMLSTLVEGDRRAVLRRVVVRQVDDVATLTSSCRNAGLPKISSRLSSSISRNR